MMKILLTLIFVFAFCSCGSEHDLEINDSGDIKIPNNSNGAIVEPEIVFADVLTEIFQKDCASCHFKYTQYNNVQKDLDGILQEVLSNSMPQFALPLSDEQKMLLQDWIALGAPEE